MAVENAKIPRVSRVLLGHGSRSDGDVAELILVCDTASTPNWAAASR